jgi:hypothetical protein
MSAVLAQLKREFTSIDADLVETILADVGNDPAKARAQLTQLSSSSDVNDAHVRVAQRVADDFESDLALALRLSTDDAAGRAAFSSHSLLRASLASLDADDADARYGGDDDDYDGRGGVHNGDDADDDDDVESVSDILSAAGASVEDSVVAELLDLISSQSLIIDELRSQNDALLKRVSELESAPGAAAAPPVAASSAPKPRVQSHRTMVYKRSAFDQKKPVAAPETAGKPVDDLTFLRELFRDEPTLSDSILQRLFAECASNLAAATDACLRWLNHPFADADSQAIEALLAADDGLTIDPYRDDVSQLFADAKTAPQAAPHRTLASKIKIDDLSKAFPAVDRAVLESVFDMEGDTLRTVETLRAAGFTSPLYPAPAAPPAPLQPGPTWRGPADAPQRLNKPRADHLRNRSKFQKVPSKPPLAKPVPALASVPRGGAVAGGASVPSSPRDLQMQTRALFEAQTRCMRGAAALRAARKYAEASALMQQAREFQQRRQQAARRFFASSFALQPHATTIDLHGQTVAEAMQLFDETLELVRQQRLKSGQEMYLTVITGVGHNSPNGVARIQPAVHRRLQQLGLNFRTTNNGGCFVIRI